MAANTSPIFVLTPNVGWATAITAANTATDGTGTVSTIFTAGSNGSFVQSVRLKPAGTNVASEARVFINNGSTNTTASNNVYLADVTLPAVTISQTAAAPDCVIPLNIAIPAGYKINIVLATAVANGWIPLCLGGDY